jgi:ABC-2 type transport system ATP-binding protein
VDDELTAYENMHLHAVLYGVNEHKNKIIDLLKFVSLDDRKDDFVKKFSGGMKRRLEIARSLLHHPKVLFLDEPTVGLDPQTRNSMWNYIIDLNKKEKLTIFFTTHYMEEAERYAKRIAIIDHGKIIAIGSSAELKKKTKTKTLEDAFLKFTGKGIRDEDASAIDFMRQRRRVMHR